MSCNSFDVSKSFLDHKLSLNSVKSSNLFKKKYCSYCWSTIIRDDKRLEVALEVYILGATRKTVGPEIEDRCSTYFTKLKKHHYFCSLKWKAEEREACRDREGEWSIIFSLSFLFISVLFYRSIVTFSHWYVVPIDRLLLASVAS